MTYPETPRGDIVETLHGRSIADPYRWLEDPDAPDVVAWVAEQRAYAESQLAALPGRAWFTEVMERVVARPRAGIPRHKSGWFFLNRNDGRQAQDVWVVGDSLEACTAEDARVILDPNTWSADGTSSLGSFTVSGDGRLLAYTVSEGGSDWQTIRLLDIATGEAVEKAEVVTKFCEPEWLPDSSSYLYLSYAEAGESDGTTTAMLSRARLMRRRLGTPREADELVLEFPDDERLMFWGQVTADDAWLAIALVRGTENRNRLWMYPLTTADGVTSIGEPLKIVDDDVAEVTPIRTIGTPGVDARLLVASDLDAPLGRVLSYDLVTPGAPAEVVREGSDALSGVVAAGEHLLVERLVDATAVLIRHDLDGHDLGRLDLPAGGIVAVDGSPTHPDAYVGISTVTDPTAAYAIDSLTGETRALNLATSERIAPEVTITRARATSADGTEVPYFVIRGTDAGDGPKPTLLWGYGGFKIPIAADYRPGWSGWLAAGGTLAIANLRGGGEYGTEWYDDGRLANKQHVFDDIIAVSEHLVASGVTGAGQLALHGRSNGGLLVGAAMTQRPDLYGAVLPAVGVLDLLRFHLFTIGYAWMSDYGDPGVAEDFETALAYSPLHNVVDGTCYPPTLVMTADHDDRVVPLHSFKFGAALQHAQGCDNPVLLRIESSAGHGAGKSSAMVASEWADALAFAANYTGLEV